MNGYASYSRLDWLCLNGVHSPFQAGAPNPSYEGSSNNNLAGESHANLAGAFPSPTPWLGQPSPTKRVKKDTNTKIPCSTKQNHGLETMAMLRPAAITIKILFRNNIEH